jgi:TPR repeat protein
MGAYGMNRTFKAAAAALIFGVGFACSAVAVSIEDDPAVAAAADALADREALAAYQKGDYATALRLWRFLAVIRGNSNAQSMLGDMYDKGQGVERDYETAVDYYSKAAAQGDGVARSNLRAMLRRGIAAYEKSDYATALQLMLPLAENGDSSAQATLGLLYFNGWGVPQNDWAAARWYSKAAEQGDALAQNNLGVMYDEGRGVPQDHALAHMWYNLAAASGDKVAAKNRDIAAKQMTPAQIAEAQKLAREWKPK